MSLKIKILLIRQCLKVQTLYIMAISENQNVDFSVSIFGSRVLTFYRLNVHRTFVNEFEFECWCLTPLFATLWRPASVMGEPQYSERTTDPGQATGKLYLLRLRVECTLFFVIYKAG